MIISKEATVKWNRWNRKYHESKGYQFTDYGLTFLVKFEDLQFSPNALIDVECPNCLQARTVQYSNYIRRKTDNCRLCSSRLSVKNIWENEAHREKTINSISKRGEDSWNWKGGEKRDRKNNAPMSDWRKQVYKRDNYTCQVCLKTNKYLNAHHLDGFAKHEDKRYDLDNGITLCRECHYDFHKIYKNRYATKEDFFEYISSAFFTNINTLKQVLGVNENV